LRLRDSYDVPEEIANGDHSPAFGKFLWNWFGDTTALTHGELDLSFLEEQNPDELQTARALIRRNLELGCNHNHIVQGAAAFGDLQAVPILRRMLDSESDQSRRLTLAGALWNLVRDPVFVECLNEAKAQRRRLVGFHLDQVLWLDDERAVDFLIDLFDNKDVGNRALALLNTLEFGRPTVPLPATEMPHQMEYYRSHRREPAFRASMTAAIRRWNRETKTGMIFGWREATARDPARPAQRGRPGSQ
jgi:hypothetical protein